MAPELALLAPELALVAPELTLVAPELTLVAPEPALVRIRCRKSRHWYHQNWLTRAGSGAISATRHAYHLPLGDIIIPH